MEKKRKIRTYGGYFEAFMETLTEKEQDKIQYGLLLLKTQERLSTKFVKFVQDGVFEDGNIVVLFNGFQKKAQKTPGSEIDKALKIKEEYYADKQSSNSRL